MPTTNGIQLKISNRLCKQSIAVRKHAYLLKELTCHMGSHSVTCHTADVTLPPLHQPIKAGTRFTDPRVTWLIPTPLLTGLDVE